MVNACVMRGHFLVSRRCLAIPLNRQERPRFSVCIIRKQQRSLITDSMRRKETNKAGGDRIAAMKAIEANGRRNEDFGYIRNPRIIVPADRL